MAGGTFFEIGRADIVGTMRSGRAGNAIMAFFSDGHFIDAFNAVKTIEAKRAAFDLAGCVFFGFGTDAV